MSDSRTNDRAQVLSSISSGSGFSMKSAHVVRITMRTANDLFKMAALKDTGQKTFPHRLSVIDIARNANVRICAI